ncbi:ribonuclease D [Aestuariicella hydrocarbonica]|uniref:Ribonuclease D n=1 Tax=Pseudomaricurvus hydrocarbonicus TaxID=1470433 RepID=A0A9E5JSH4_9GAMM|nr:ribonuclease D [Aestuariicella hydrocarbonica]NHO64738.1 ribonuclease D [Aestuariicella hydrocarbonica]
MSVIPQDPIWINETAELERLCERWNQQAAIAVDTEFMRSTTFFPKAALFQVGDGQGCYLIDPLAIDDFSAFQGVMRNPEVIKVLHSCSEDLEVFQTFMGQIPTPVFDTQIAAAIAGHGFSLGYAKLIEVLMNVPVPKSETRSDWLQRPLSKPQLQYAALDVAYLLVAYGLLRKQLKQNGRLAWVEKDCADMLAQAERGIDFDQMYLKIKSAWKLNRPQLAVLQALTAWREEEARARDVPRNRLIKEHALWDMARYQPTELKQISGLEGMTARILKEDGDTLLSIIAESEKLPEEACPLRLPKPLPPEQGDLLKSLKHFARETAVTLGIAPEVLVRKKDFEDLVRSGMENSDYSLNERLSGWRREVVGQGLLTLAQQWSAGQR